MTVPLSPTACVVVPLYRTALPKYEQASLERCISVLKSHPITIIKPKCLDTTDLLRDHPHVQCEDFADDYFKSIDGYNRLLLSDSFYARFAAYEYILIHQLDAFVFQDQLQAWCDRHYDYIGAPWLPDPIIPRWTVQLGSNIRRRIFRWTNQRARYEPGIHYSQYKYAVGNGGFSLRRVKRMREVLAELAAKAEEYRRGELAVCHEDLFFCVEANRYWNRVKVPTFRQAAHFAWELQPTAAATLTHGNLPFGCHGWNKLHRDEWRPIFARLGYDLDELLR